MTMADFLNAVDGATSGNNNVMIVTTNYPEKLDAAVLRPGRVDRTYEFGYLTQNSFDNLIERYFQEPLSFPVPEKLTAAKAQAAYIQNRDSFEDFRTELGG